MAQNLTYLLAPNFTFKPHTGPIALGTIVADPFRPHRILTTIDRDTLNTRYPRVEKAIEHGFAVARGTGHDVAVAIWAQFIEAVGGRVSGEREAQTMKEYTMDTLETEYFINDPDYAEIESRVAEPRVRAVMASSGLRLRQPVYMITGIKVAKGFEAKLESGRGVGGVIEGSGIIPNPVGEVTVGASVGGGVSKSERNEWKAAEDIVFAYQLLKIEYKGWRGKRLEVDEFSSKAAYLGIDDEDSSDGDHINEKSQKENVELSVAKATALDLEAVDEDHLASTTSAEVGDDRVYVVSFHYQS